MTCPGCRHESPHGSRFCFECGRRLSATCASCGHELPAESKFCNQCGTSVAAVTAATPRTPDSYTPSHLVERILTSKAALEGERKQVTVLFADLKGSMELLADRDPEEARRILDPVLEHMIEAVHRYEGIVNQVMGDGIMALFGAPVAHEDHAVRACYAALRMQESIKRYSEGVRRAEGVPIRIRVGLNSGEVVVRAIGSDLHMDYTAVGQTTHLAARMEQLAAPDTIALTPAALALAEGFVEVRSLGPTAVKGISEPMEVFELTGASAVRSRLQAAAARGLTKFVGRSAEMAQLEEALDLAKSRHGQVVAVIGEAGVGKSRLLWEFTHSHRTTGCVVVEAASVSYGKATPYVPIIELLKNYFSIERRDNPRNIREKVTGRVLSLDRAHEAILPPLLALLDVPVDDDSWNRLDPTQRRQQTFDAVKRLLLRESQVQPIIVVFEDLHWIDTATQAFLDTFQDSVPTARVVMLVNYRPEYQHSWGSKTFYRQLRIDALSPVVADELLDAVLGADGALGLLKRRLIERTDGNPFFLEESVRALVESAVLTGHRGAYRLARPIESLEMPATAQTILAARIDRLEPEDKRLLQAAAVIGKDFATRLLQAITDMTDEALVRGLGRLRAAEFVYETRLFPESEYTFKHALTHEVAYGAILTDRRRALHARVVDVIERGEANRPAEDVDRLAHHAFVGEVWEKAIEYLRRAGEKAAACSANRDAGAFFERALVACRRLPETREHLETMFEVLLERRATLFPLGDMEGSVACVRDAEAIAERLADERLLARVWCEYGRHHWIANEPDCAVALCERALAVSAIGEDLHLLVRARDVLGRAYFSLGEHRRAVVEFTRNIESLTGELAYERFGAAGLQSVFARYLAAFCHTELGEFLEADERAREAITLAEAAMNPHSVIAAHVGLGYSALGRGDFSRAVQALDKAMAICKDADITIWFPGTASLLGHAWALSGRVAEATELQEHGLSRPGSDAPSRAIRLGETYLIGGRLDDARSFGARGLEQALRGRQRGYQAWARRLLGEVAAALDPPDTDVAEAQLREALALADMLAMRPLVAHCHAGLGKLHRRIDKRAVSTEHTAMAAAMYRELKMLYRPDMVDA